MFKRSLLLLSLVMMTAVANEETSVPVVSTEVTEASTSVDTQKGKAGFFASASSALKSTGKFAVGMVNPMGWYAAGRAAVTGVFKRQVKATGATLWNEHRAAVAGMSVAALLVAAELYDNLVSKAFNKAKAFVEEQLS